MSTFLYYFNSVCQTTALFFNFGTLIIQIIKFIILFMHNLKLFIALTLWHIITNVVLAVKLVLSTINLMEGRTTKKHSKGVLRKNCKT